MLKITAPLNDTALPGGTRTARAIHANPALKAAVTAHAPRYFELQERLQRLIDTARQVEPGPTDDTLTTLVLDALASGDGVPADFLRTVAATPHPEAVFERAANVLHGIAGALTFERDDQVAARLPQIRGHLADQLAKTIAAATKLLDAPADAEAAITAGRTEDYEQARELESRYEQIRAAQRAIWTRETAADTWWTVVGYIADPQAAWPDYLPWLNAGQRLLVETEGTGTLVTSPPWPDLTSAPALWWLARRPEARPWIPRTAEDYEQATLSLELASARSAQGARRTPTPRRAVAAPHIV